MQDRHVSLYRKLQCIFNSLFGVVCFILYSQSVVQRTNISTFCTWFGFSSSARSCNVYLLPLRGFVNPVQSSVVMFALPLLVMANSQKLLSLISTKSKGQKLDQSGSNECSFRFMAQRERSNYHLAYRTTHGDAHNSYESVKYVFKNIALSLVFIFTCAVSRRQVCALR